ncbi:MAG: DUF4170 domain-containing protein [Alphaproteobacteria bacterium]|jgi:hypothetical protein|nr:DUF4170 domain-containing protein [Alphaproteobacteria bacterium]MBT4019576.1 DUF4170 domain-containing protein [Alphaproteobacteria bacterium]MBT5160801.1 DUF4170 domain-containing protein [Alphaproteobacteria bacterium]MBT5918871.1 DUF4170 domain-containing protein [Alphaproteobacteria bacterium]MBT6386731.1 DUF4170 domain-containing protein [Alphaproteobacteria bacterium]
MSKQLLHMVLGGRLTDATSTEFENLDEVDIVGVFPNYDSAHKAWQAKAYATVDDAMTRYFIVHMHRLMDPDQDEH